MFSESKYLERLSIERSAPDFPYLRKLHYQHLLNIPFENLDIVYTRRRIVLDLDKIFDKIINFNRGGFCYEVNGLFNKLLQSLGFETYLISGEVLDNETGQYGPPYDHMAIVVTIGDDKYLVDIGFGNGFQYPLKLSNSKWQVDGNMYYRIYSENDQLYLVGSKDMQEERVLYRFTLEKRQLIEFIAACDDKQDSSESHFVKNRIVTKLTNQGKVVIRNDEFKETILGKTEITQIQSEFDLKNILDEKFSLTLT